MNLVISKCVTAVKVWNFSGHYLHNRSTLDIGVLGYIGIFEHKEHSPEVLSIPPGTPCILCVLYWSFKFSCLRMGSKKKLRVWLDYVPWVSISTYWRTGCDDYDDYKNNNRTIINSLRYLNYNNVAHKFNDSRCWRSWLRHCAASRKVAVSIPDGVIGIF